MAAWRGSFFSERSLSVCTFYRSWIYRRRRRPRPRRFLRPMPMLDTGRRRLKDGSRAHPSLSLPRSLLLRFFFFSPFFCADGFLRSTYWRRWCINVIAFRMRDKTVNDESAKRPSFFQTLTKNSRAFGWRTHVVSIIKRGNGWSLLEIHVQLYLQLYVQLYLLFVIITFFNLWEI